MLKFTPIVGARLLKLHYELFWYMYPSCVTKENSNYCYIHHTKQLQLTPWYFSLVSLSLLLFLLVPSIASSGSWYNNLVLNFDYISGNYWEGYTFLVLQFSFAVSLTCLCLNCVMWTHKNELVLMFNSVLQMSREKAYSKHATYLQCSLNSQSIL